MTTTRHFGLSAARTPSQVRRSTSIREATGKPRTVASGRAAQTYFDFDTDLRPFQETDPTPPPPHTPTDSLF